MPEEQKSTEVSDSGIEQLPVEALWKIAGYGDIQAYLRVAGANHRFHGALLGSLRDSKDEKDGRDNFCSYIKNLDLPELQSLFMECPSEKSSEQFFHISRALLDRGNAYHARYRAASQDPQLAAQAPELNRKAQDIYYMLSKNDALDADLIQGISERPNISRIIKIQLARNKNTPQQVLEALLLESPVDTAAAGAPVIAPPEANLPAGDDVENFNGEPGFGNGQGMEEDFGGGAGLEEDFDGGLGLQGGVGGGLAFLVGRQQAMSLPTAIVTREDAQSGLIRLALDHEEADEKTLLAACRNKNTTQGLLRRMLGHSRVTKAVLLSLAEHSKEDKGFGAMILAHPASDEGIAGEIIKKGNADSVLLKRLSETEWEEPDVLTSMNSQRVLTAICESDDADKEILDGVINNKSATQEHMCLLAQNSKLTSEQIQRILERKTFRKIEGSYREYVMGFREGLLQLIADHPNASNENRRTIIANANNCDTLGKLIGIKELHPDIDQRIKKFPFPLGNKQDLQKLQDALNPQGAGLLRRLGGDVWDYVPNVARSGIKIIIDFSR